MNETIDFLLGMVNKMLIHLVEIAVTLLRLLLILYCLSFLSLLKHANIGM